MSKTASRRTHFDLDWWLTLDPLPEGADPENDTYGVPQVILRSRKPQRMAGRFVGSCVHVLNGEAHVSLTGCTFPMGRRGTTMASVSALPRMR